MNNQTEQIFIECVGCLKGMELYTDENGTKRKHRVSFEAEIGKFSHIKKGDFITDKLCPDCNEPKLIRV